jgi:hypothetical protein
MGVRKRVGVSMCMFVLACSPTSPACKGHERIILSSVASLAQPNVFTLSHKGHYFGRKALNLKRVF